MTERTQAGESAVSEQVGANDWQRLDGVDPATAEFPLRTRYNGQPIVVLRTASGYRGIQRSCPHQKRSLHDAHFQGDSMIRCRSHGFVYRLSDGRGVNCPGFRIQVYDVKAEDGSLLVRPAS